MAIQQDGPASEPETLTGESRSAPPALGPRPPAAETIAKWVVGGLLVLAIVALTSGKFFGWTWLDSVVGIVGSAVVFSWAYSLLRDTSGILLDRTPASSDLPDEIRKAIESDGDSVVTDLHVWQVGAGKFAAIVSIVAHEPRPSDYYRALFREHDELVHVTIETQHCREDHETVANS